MKPLRAAALFRAPWKPRLQQTPPRAAIPADNAKYSCPGTVASGGGGDVACRRWRI